MEDTNWEPPVDVKIKHCSVVNLFLFIAQFEHEKMQQDCCENFHLSISKFLPQANSRTSLFIIIELKCNAFSTINLKKKLPEIRFWVSLPNMNWILSNITLFLHLHLLKKKFRKINEKCNMYSADLEGCKFEGTLGLVDTILVKPTLWSKFLSIITPYVFHPSHCIRLVSHHITFLYIIPIR